MRYRLLGRTGLYVSELCLGTMTFGGQGHWKVMGGLGQDAVTALVKQAFAADGQGPAGARRASFDFPVVDKARAFRCVDAMRPIAQRREVSVARVALAWLLSRPPVSTVIVGAKTPEQLADNLAASRLELSAEELAALDAVSALPPEYPGWMLAMQGQYRAKPPTRD